jgi:hypothetical protein
MGRLPYCIPSAFSSNHLRSNLDLEMISQNRLPEIQLTTTIKPRSGASLLLTIF